MRNEKRRLTSFVVALCMIIGLFAAAPAFADTENVNTGTIYTADYWVGTGFTVDSSWGQFTYNNWGGSGRYVYDRYDFTDDFTFTSSQLNVFGNTAYMLFCYQDDNNYYKLTIGTSNSLTKVVNGTSTTLATSSSSLAGKEISVRIAHAADGTITATYGSKGGNGTGTAIFRNATVVGQDPETGEDIIEYEDVQIVDTDLTHGKIGIGFQNSGGYFAIMSASGATIVEETPEPTVAPTAAPYTVDYSENFNNFTESSLWINCGQTPLSVADGVIGGSNWTNESVYLYTGKTFGSVSYTYSADLKKNWGGSEGNKGGILFNYTSAAGANGANQRGYSIEVCGGTSGKVILKKYTQDLWNNVVTLKTHKVPVSLQNKDVRLNVTYISDGRISADLVVNNTTYSIFKDIKDTTYKTGYIGFIKGASNFEFDNVNVTAAPAAYFSLDNAEFTQDGNEVTVTADVTLGDSNASFVTAAYDENGVLIGLDIASADDEYSRTFAVSGTVANVMTTIWNMSTFNPFCSTSITAVN